MGGMGRIAILTCVTLAMSIGLSLPPASADETLDTSKLPRVDGTKDIFASPPSTIFTAPQPVAETADGTVKALTGAGWQQYAPAFAEQAKIPNMFLSSFKKGPVGLSVFINVAPAQSNATSVTYTGVALTNDLPFPKDATEIKFDADRPHLECVTAGTVEATSDFFRTELIARGWSPWSEKQGTKAAYADQKNDKGIYAYYVHDQQKPLLLTVEAGDGGKTTVKLESVPAELLITADKRTPPKEPDAAAAPAPKTADKIGEAFDAIANDIMKQAQKATSDALAGVNAPPAKSESEGAAPEPELTRARRQQAPIPLPSTAEDVEYDSAAGRLEFNSASSVKQVAAFYRAQMAPLGWAEQKSVINQDNMVNLEFHKGEQEVSLTVLKMGASVNVSANGSALEKEAAAPQSSEGEPAASPTEPQAAEALEAEDAGGLAGSQAAHVERQRNVDVPPRCQRQRAGEARHGSCVLSRRTRQARRLEGRYRTRRHQGRRRRTPLRNRRRARRSEARPQQRRNDGRACRARAG